MAIRINRDSATKPKPIAELTAPGAVTPSFEILEDPLPWGSHSRTPKALITLRVDIDVLERFKATGYGWSTRMNAALRKAAGL